MAYPSNTNSDNGGKLRVFIDRILRMREEAAAIKDDIKEIYAEAKASGFDKTAIGNVVRFLEKSSDDIAKAQEQDALFDLYLNAYNDHPSRAHAHARDAGPTAYNEPARPALQDESGGPSTGQGTDPPSGALPVDTPSEPGNGQHGVRPGSAGAQAVDERAHNPISSTVPDEGYAA